MKTILIDGEEYARPERFYVRNGCVIGWFEASENCKAEWIVWGEDSARNVRALLAGGVKYDGDFSIAVDNANNVVEVIPLYEGADECSVIGGDNKDAVGKGYVVHTIDGTIEAWYGENEKYESAADVVAHAV